MKERSAFPPVSNVSVVVAHEHSAERASTNRALSTGRLIGGVVLSFVLLAAPGLKAQERPPTQAQRAPDGAIAIAVGRGYYGRMRLRVVSRRDHVRILEAHSIEPAHESEGLTIKAPG